MTRIRALLLLALIITGCDAGNRTETPAGTADTSPPAPVPSATSPAATESPGSAARDEATLTLDAIERETARLDEWFDARFEEFLDFRPMMKTRIGRKEDYDRLDDFSEAANEAQLEWRRRTVADLKESFEYALLTLEAKTSYDLWLYQAEQAELASRFMRRDYLFHQMGGLHTSLPQFLITNHRVDNEGDMLAWIERAGETGRAIRQMLERARLASGEGVHAPRYAYEAVIAQAAAVITGAPFDGSGNATDGGNDTGASVADDAASSPLWADANAKIDALVDDGAIDANRAAELRAAAAAGLTGRLQPAYQELIEWAESELPLTDEIATGVWKLPDGPAYYEARLAAMTTTDMTAEEIHAIGLSEVERIHREMQAIMERVEFDGTLTEFFAFVREDPMFYYPNTDEGRQAYLDTARRHLDFISERLPDYFGLLPQAGLEVRRVEPFREVAGQAQHYQRGTPDGSRPGVYYSHLIDMGSMPIPTMEVIAYHEGIPGHHMQLSIAQERTGLPTFRTLAGFTAFSEGWGLYAEALAKEMGAYEDPYSDFGRLTSEIWRAIRLVVDTGLHAEQWTEEQAVEYMLENSAISEGQIRAEVRRYIVMPGQATAYKIGMMKIQELRAGAEAALGDRFDIREFHDVVLGSGGLPLSLLERRISDWLTERMGSVI